MELHACRETKKAKRNIKKEGERELYSPRITVGAG